MLRWQAIVLAAVAAAVCEVARLEKIPDGCVCLVELKSGALIFQTVGLLIITVILNGALNVLL